MMFLSNWLNGFGEIRNLPVSSQYLSGKSVYLGSESLINDALHRGGAVVVRLILMNLIMCCSQVSMMVWWKCLTLIIGQNLLTKQDILLVTDRETSCNRLVPEQYFNQEGETIYALGPFEGREAVILFNGRTKLEPEKTIEYFI